MRYEYDAAGRVTLRQQKQRSTKPRTWRYTWDSEDRLVQLTAPDGTRWQYSYDPLGRRIGKHRIDTAGTLAEQINFTWDGALLVEQGRKLVDSALPGSTGQTSIRQVHVTTWEHVPGSTFPVAQISTASPESSTERQPEVDQEFYAIVADLTGAPTELVAPGGEVAWQRRTTLWGLPRHVGAGTVDCPLRFPGQYHDPESEADYNYFRYYDPSLARYHSADPLGLDAGPNPYAYVPNPTAAIDPLGLKACEIFERYGSELEAKASQDAGGLVPKPAPHQNNPKWIGEDGSVDPRTLGKRQNYTHRIEFHAKPGTRDWLKQFEVKPTNEPGRYAVPAKSARGVQQAGRPGDREEKVVAVDAFRREFLRAVSAGAHDPGDLTTRDREFVQALLEFASETDDNTQCVEHVGIGGFQDPQGRSRVGPILRDTGVPVSDLLNAAEGMAMPPQMLEDFPEVTQEDFDSALRLAVLVLLACESPYDGGFVPKR